MNNLAGLSAEQRQLLELLLREEGADPNAILPIPNRPFAGWAPLSSAQQRMWFAYRQAPEDPTYNIQTALRIQGALDIAGLIDAIGSLVARHETLRTAFTERDGNIVQCIHEAYPVEVVRLKIEDPIKLNDFISAEASRAWDLSRPQSLRATLIECGEQAYVLLLGMHHILSDAWSVGTLARELWQIYDARQMGVTADLPALSTNYADYSHWEQNTEATEIQKHRDFWRSKLSDAIDQISLPLDRERHTVHTSQANLFEWSFPPESVAAARKVAQSSRCSMFSVCLSAFYLLLAEQTGRRDILVASPVANRERAELEPLIGYFANTVVLRAEWSPSNSFNDLVARVHSNSLEVLSHQGYPFERVVEDFNPRRINGVNPLAQIFFAFQKHALSEVVANQLKITEYENTTRSTRFDLESHVWETPQGGIDAVLIYPPLFEPKTIEYWARRWSELLVLACTQSEVALGSWLTLRTTIQPQADQDLFKRVETLLKQLPCITDVSIQPSLETNEIEYLAPEDLYSLKDRNRPKPAPRQESSQAVQQNQRPALISGGPIGPDSALIRTLPELLIRAATKFPESGCFFISSGQQLSYLHLLTEARKIQACLESTSLRPGDILLFQLDTEQAVITYFWGAVFAGIIPLIQSPANPALTQAYEQVMAIWELLERPAVLVTTKTVSGWESQPARVINIDQFDLIKQVPAPESYVAHPEDIAFFSQSSGTSGRPKGIPLSHQNIVTRAIAARDFTGIDSTRTMLNWQPLNHIASMSDWHVRGVVAGSNLIYGHTADVLAQPLLWLDWLERFQVTDTWAPNFAYTRVVEELNRPANATRRWDLSKLKLCLSAGESIVTDILDQFEDRLENSAFRKGVLQPAFGMAETASGSTYHQPIPDTRVVRHRVANESRSFVGCGAPIPGITVRVIDDNGALRKEGEIGHVQFQGPAVFSGYYNEPALNKERISADKWFDSGDLGFILEGHLFITGRDKAEIIVNGRNISSESIEIALGALPEVRAGDVAVCTVFPSASNKERIAIFFTPKQKDVSPGTLRALSGFIVEQYGFLPDYLLPIDRNDIPRTALGKIRRHILVNQFNAGDFDDAIRKQSAQRAVIPDSFYQKNWRRTPLEFIAKTSLTIYILSKGSEISESLAERLNSDGYRAQIIKDCDQIHQNDFHLIDLTLFETSPSAHQPQRPLHAAEHLRVLFQRLANQSIQTCRLTSVTCLTQATGRESELRFDDAVCLGILKTASQEFGDWLKVRHIDLDQSALYFQVDALLDELQASRFASEVVYRAQRRFEPVLKRVNLHQGSVVPSSPFNNDGFIIVSGGMGGLGRILSARLHDEFGARLLLIGRSPLNASDQKWIESRQGLAYVQTDISDVQALKQAVISQEKIWNLPLQCVLHLAGTGNWTDQTENIAQYRITGLHADSWTSQFNAKVQGTCNLFELVQQRPGSTFIAASSLIGVFGGSSFSVYAAANSFLHTFCRAQALKGHPDTTCLHWPSWLDTGMSAGQRPEYAAGSGFLNISPEAGWHIFLASLIHQQHDLMIGLDPYHSRSGFKKSATIFYTSDDQVKAAREIAKIAHLPWVQASYSIDFQYVSKIPTTDSASEQNAVNSNETRDQLEHQKKLKAIFQDVLKIERVGLDDNFFELGAHSLLMAAIEARIIQEVSDKLELLDLFRFPTIRRLARYVVSMHTESADEASSPTISTQRSNTPSSSRAQLREARNKHRQGRST